jgi:hypothetical protein
VVDFLVFFFLESLELALFDLEQQAFPSLPAAAQAAFSSAEQVFLLPSAVLEQQAFPSLAAAAQAAFSSAVHVFFSPVEAEAQQAFPSFLPAQAAFSSEEHAFLSPVADFAQHAFFSPSADLLHDDFSVFALLSVAGASDCADVVKANITSAPSNKIFFILKIIVLFRL